MPNTRHSSMSSGRGLARPIAAALAIKAVALAAIYWAFFVPPAPPTADRAATAVLGLPGR